MSKKELRKLRKLCKKLAYQAQKLELEQRIAELQGQPKQPMGFVKKEKS